MASGLSAEDTMRRVAAAREGDRAAFGALYDGYWRLVHGVFLTWFWSKPCAIKI
jgi:hypothetical protein